LEIFELDDLDAALARFEEVGREYRGNADSVDARSSRD
jgi:hypothetical protein